MSNVGFIGVGYMGYGIAKNILEKGNRYNSVTNTVEEFQRSAGMKDNQILYNRTPLSFIAKVVAQVYGIRINLKTKNELYFTGAIPLNDQEKALQPCLSKDQESHASEMIAIV